MKAAYAEVLVPVFDRFELTGAIRVDDYTGFGTTTNPKVSVKFEPVDWAMVRGSYNTGFRVPTFNQIFNGATVSPYSGQRSGRSGALPGGVPSAPSDRAALRQDHAPTSSTGGNPVTRAGNGRTVQRRRSSFARRRASALRSTGGRSCR